MGPIGVRLKALISRQILVGFATVGHRLPHLLFHVSMETQQVQRLVIGRGPAEDGLEEAEEELHGLTARHEDDHLVPLGKLHTHTHTHTH